MGINAAVVGSRRRTVAQRIIRDQEHPPIISVTSRTLAAPLKDQRFYRTPSQTIGNNYSPQVQHLRVKGLHQQLTALHKPGSRLPAPSRPRGAFWNSAIRPSLCPSVSLSHGAAA